MSDEILAYARARNVTKIVVGKPERPRWQRIASGSIVDDARAGQRRDRRLRDQRRRDERAAAAAPARGSAPTRLDARTARRVVAVAICDRARVADVPVLRRSPTSSWSTCWGSSSSRCASAAGLVLASVLSVAAFDFFFVPPYFTFAVSRRPVPGHLRGDAGGRARDQQPHRAHPRPGRGGAASASGARPRSTR